MLYVTFSNDAPSDPREVEDTVVLGPYPDLQLDVEEPHALRLLVPSKGICIAWLGLARAWSIMPGYDTTRDRRTYAHMIITTEAP